MNEIQTRKESNLDEYKEPSEILIPNPTKKDGRILFDNEAVANFPVSEGTYGIVTICMNADCKFFCRKSMKPLQPGFDEYTVSKFVDREIRFSDFLSRHLNECPNCFAPTIYRKDNTDLVIDMILMPNGNLAEIIDASRIYPKIDELLSEVRILIILFGIAVGLDCIHGSFQCVYRDLKPDNILLDDNFYPFLCDFGSIIPQKNLTIRPFASNQVWKYLYYSNHTNTPYVGSYQYMSPSVLLQPEEVYTPDIDIYAFGLTAYHLLTKRCPYLELFTDVKDPKLLASEIVKNPLECDFGKKYQNNPDFYAKMENIIKDCTSVQADCTLYNLPSSIVLVNKLLECSDFLPVEEQIIFQNYAGTYIRQTDDSKRPDKEGNGILFDHEYWYHKKINERIGNLDLIAQCAENLIGFPLYTMAFITYFGLGTQQDLFSSAEYFRQASEIDYRNSKKLYEQIIDFMKQNGMIS